MNILIFAFATFFLWGWILLWPISKIQYNDKLKAYLHGVGLVLIVLSLAFVFGSGKLFGTFEEAKELYFGNFAWIWWSLYVFGAIISAVAVKYWKFIENYGDAFVFTLSATAGSWLAVILAYGLIHWLAIDLFWNGLILPLTQKLF